MTHPENELPVVEIEWTLHARMTAEERIKAKAAPLIRGYGVAVALKLVDRYAAQLAEMETFLKSSPLMGKDRPPPPPRLKDLVIKTVGPANGDVIEYEYEVDAAEVPCKVIIRRLKTRK